MSRKREVDYRVNRDPSNACYVQAPSHDHLSTKQNGRVRYRPDAERSRDHKTQRPHVALRSPGHWIAAVKRASMNDRVLCTRLNHLEPVFPERVTVR
jgi:hypothetical protein